MKDIDVGGDEWYHRNAGRSRILKIVALLLLVTVTVTRVADAFSSANIATLQVAGARRWTLTTGARSRFVPRSCVTTSLHSTSLASFSSLLSLSAELSSATTTIPLEMTNSISALVESMDIDPLTFYMGAVIIFCYLQLCAVTLRPRRKDRTSYSGSKVRSDSILRNISSASSSSDSSLDGWFPYLASGDDTGWIGADGGTDGGGSDGGGRDRGGGDGGGSESGGGDGGGWDIGGSGSGWDSGGGGSGWDSGGGGSGWDSGGGGSGWDSGGGGGGWDSGGGGSGWD